MFIIISYHDSKLVAKTLPSIKALFAKAEEFLGIEEAEIKSKLKDKLKPLMTRYDFSVDLLKNDTDFARFWDLIGTFFIGNKVVEQNLEKNTQSNHREPRERMDMKLPVGLGVIALVLLCVAGAIILFCT